MAHPDPIFALRPVDGSATAIRDALARARQAQADADAAILTAKQDRDGLLIDGSARQLADADAAVDMAERAVDRIGAMVVQLEKRLAPAESAERQDANAAMLTQWEVADRAYKAWCNAQLPGIMETIKAGVVLHNASIGCRRTWHGNMLRTAERHPDEPIAQPTWDVPLPDWIADMDSALRDMQLP